MKSLKALILGSLLLANSAAYAVDFGFSAGPFNMHFNALDENRTHNRTVLGNPICYAISNLNRLEIIVEGNETISTKEKKTIIKKLIIEPYAFGITKEGRPILHGNVIEDKLIKEITVKFGEDKFAKSAVSSNEDERGYFSGLFKSSKNQNIDITKISDILVLEDTHFDVPKNYKGLEGDQTQIICQIPVNQQK